MDNLAWSIKYFLDKNGRYKLVWGLGKDFGRQKLSGPLL